MWLYFNFCKQKVFVFHLCAVNTATVSHPAIFVVLLGLVALTALSGWLQSLESQSQPIRGKNSLKFSPAYSFCPLPKVRSLCVCF